ncbi:MBL fold metallo-hydrolase [Taibaiella soli]|uniref:MBL fold metallo-hydrolase n=1 Tax=Taibaiella soli TaxID=1649169 RepID=A0A2W2BJR8_9BACT|nr:MBL fold metallo-hydrolase [Taibaiella soli]PZF73686.1 MBL fold metallo-hydrolase [Taibaiella soli]
MKITFLGTGTSQGVPVIGCDCNVCTSTDKRDKRLRSAVWVETPEASIVIDSGPDFRYQMLRANVRKLDALVFTHGHKDHIAGMDDVRAYNYFQQKAMDVYATKETQDSLHREFSYIFAGLDYPGIPQINLHTITPDRPFFINGLELIPIRVLHYRLEVLGFRIGDFTYITDANFIAPEELAKAKGSKVFVLNALRREPHISHFTLNEAVAIAKEVGAEQTYFTHISHQLGLHEELNEELPKGMQLAYDTLSFEL